MDKNEALRKLTTAKGLALALVAASCTPEGAHMLVMESGGKDGRALCATASTIYETLEDLDAFFGQ